MNRLAVSFVVLAAALLPLVAGDYMLRAILIPFLILALGALGLNVLVGYCGQISLGSGAFMAIGAYSAYKFGTGIHIPLELFTIDIPPLPVFWCIMLGG